MTKKLNTMNNLQLLLSSKFWTIKDLHAEIVLIICHVLIANYLEDENNKHLNSNSLITNEENKKIYALMTEIFVYLSQNIISYPKIIQIMNDSKKTKQDEIKARFIEPYYYFYNIIENAFFSRLDFVTNQTNEKQYIPDFLAITLIANFKEKAGQNSFKKFEYIHSLDFSDILGIYAKVQFKQKEQYNIKINTPIQEQTTIRKMRHISNYMINKLFEARYISKKTCTVK